MKIFNWNSKKDVANNVTIKPDSTVKVPPTSGRKTRPTFEETYYDLRAGVKYINPSFIREIIPLIRKLCYSNSDFGLALNDLVKLTNTGHWVKFDQSINTQQRTKMREHLREVSKTWGEGVHGIDGLVNKLISQIWISGALSSEWVVNNSKTGIENCAIVNPETIYWAWEKSKRRFAVYQKQDYKTGENLTEKMVRLNPITYKYFAINGDTEIPYGIPPFLTALNYVKPQLNMDKNIDHIMEQLGLLGFFETKVEKPMQRDGESDDKYMARLIAFLSETRKTVMEGLNSGIVVGYKDDHEFEFNATAKNLSGAVDMYSLNQVKMANGLKVSPEFFGFATNTSESAMSIIFTKMLSQLVNAQDLVRTFLEYGYELELTLAGYSKVNLSVEFKPSTITDELKYQQAMEYKIRNIENKYNMGVISQQQKAEELGYDKPDVDKPRAPIADSAAKQNREADKDKSDRKTRDKNKPTPKRKDTDTKSR